MKSLVIFVCVSLLASFHVFASDSVVVFNEIQYQPAAGDSIEWIELYNQMAVDVEIDGWRIEGADYTFPTNTIVSGGGYIVVASDPAEFARRTGLTNVFGPLGGKLANEGESLRLLNQNQRIMDELSFDSNYPWPSGPAGSGFTLAKRSPTLGSEAGENWAVSAQPGGTPGAANFPSGIAPDSILLNEIPAAGANHRWIEISNATAAAADLSNIQIQFSKSSLPAFALSNTAAVPAGGLAVIDLSSYNYVPKAGEKVFILDGLNRKVLDAVEVEDHVIGRSPEDQNQWLAAARETPGASNEFQIERNVVINEIMYHNQPQDPSPAEYDTQLLLDMDATWRYRQTGVNPGATWFAANFSDTAWQSGKGLLAVETAPLPAPINTPLQLGVTTYYFRTEFQFDGNTNGVQLALEHVVDDGAIFYLNGQEIYRFNMPGGAATSATFASAGVADAVLSGPIALPSSQLVNGRNVLAVEVHQVSSSSSDIVFGCRLSARQEIRPARGYQESTDNWVELFNKGTNAVDLSGWKLKPTGYTFTNVTIGAGEYLVVAQDSNTFASEYPGVPVIGNFKKAISRGSDLITLQDTNGNPADVVRYFDSDPWPEFPDGHGASLKLKNPKSDNSKPESWAASSNPGSWASYTYTGVAEPDGGPTQWHEFVLGLLDAGEVWLDDIIVIENPSGTHRELLQNGSFEKGTASWRMLGTHRGSEVIVDPDNPQNHILRLVADGPTEHMHNHLETTLINNSAVKNGTTYTIAFRARWIAGSNKLNTRLYFNRLPKVTVLPRPSSIGTPGRQNSTLTGNLGPAFSGLSHSPAVPKSSQSVQVRVHAEDSDGVVRCTLWWAANGTNWTSVPMSIAGNDYIATIPARSTATAVQFYVEAVDGLGAVSTYPAEGRNSRALYKVNDNQALSSRIHNFRLIMLPSEANLLHASTNVMSNGRSLCTVIYDESEIFYNCGLHLQSSERGRMDPARVGFTVSFPADHLFRGTQNSITFDRSGGWSGKGGRQDEIIMRHIINHAGDSPDMYNDLVRVLTPLTTHTGTAMLLMSKYGNSYLSDSLYPENGSLFKLELVYYPTTSVNNDPQQEKIPQPDEVIGTDIMNLGDDKEAYRWNFLPENYPDRDDYSGLIPVAQAFSLSGAALQQRTSELMDMEEWARVFAFKTLSGDSDTYGVGYQHNQLIYIPPASSDPLAPRPRALTFPWDMDFAWSRPAGDSLALNSSIGQLLNTIPANQRLFLGDIQDILNSSFNTAYISRWVTHYGALAGQNYSGVLTYIGQRAASARSQLPKPGVFRITTFNGQNGITNGTSITLRGTAPYTYKRLQQNKAVPGEGFSWTALETWESTFPLEFGANQLSVTAYDFHNNPVATNQTTVVSTTPFGRPDTDGDGIPDSWETENGLNPNDPSDANADSDGDGLSNIGEYLAGTNPFDANSRLVLNVAASGDGQLTLNFQTTAGRAYKLQYRVGTESAWQDLVKFPASLADNTVQQQQTITQAARVLFYRAVLDVGTK